MTTLLMMNDHHKFGHNSSTCMMTKSNRKSIKDLINKFEKNDGNTSKQERLYQHIDLISNLNSMKARSNMTNKDLNVENARPFSINFDSVCLPTTASTTIQHEPLKKDNSTLLEISLEDENSFQSQRPRKSRIEIKIESDIFAQAQPVAENCAWNPSRRRSSVQLVKPSSLVKNKVDQHDDVFTSEPPLPHTLLPRRVSGPIYESRRSSYSAIKPSEIWSAEELPSVLRRNSRIIDEKMNIIRKKSIAIDEADENENESKSSWVSKPNNSLFLVKPSNVKTVETSNTKKFNAVGIQAKLLAWCQQNTKNYQNVDIKNFSSSWANGLAFCALIHSFKPEAFNFHELDQNDHRRNFEVAFEAAEKHANITPLLEVDDMIQMGNKPDSKCVYTYVSTMYSKLNSLKK